MFSKFRTKLIDFYLNIQLNNPYLVVFSTFGISVLLTTYGLYYNYTVIDFDPIKGFETIGTPLSANRKTLLALKDEQSTNEELFRWYFSSKNRFKRNSTDDSIIVNYDEYGVDSEPNSSDLEDPCEFYGSIGKSIPFDVVEIMSKVMIRISSYEKIFDPEVLKHLCHIDEIIDEHKKQHNFSSFSENLKHSFNFPKYFTCPNSSISNSCESINWEISSNFKSLLQTCAKNSTEIVCDVFSVNQILNWILPRDIQLHANNNPLDILVILKIPIWNGDKSTINSYYKFIEKLNTFLSSNTDTMLVGVSMNLKNDIFIDSIYHDIIFAGISAFLVFSCFFLYSKSIIFTIIIILIIVCSAGIAFFIYTTILGFTFFPFVNLLVIVILVSIGADDAFLLLTYFRIEIEKMSNLKYKNQESFIVLYQERDLLIRCLCKSLRHSLSSMFLTSITTATTFLTNLSSHIIVLRCFGVYACVTVIVNYILVLLILPSAIIITKPISSFKLSSIGKIFASIPDKLTTFTAKFSFPIVVITLFLTCVSAFTICYSPGISLPKNNPIQILSKDNYHEYYDSNIHNYNFEWKRSARFVQNYFIGIDSGTDSSYFTGSKLRTSSYSLSLEKLEIYKDFIERHKSVIGGNKNYKYISWADKVLRLNESCLEEKPIADSCILKIIVYSHNLVNMFPDDYSVIPGDGPFFNKDRKVIGYFMSFPTSQKLRIDTEITNEVFHDINENCTILKEMVNDSLICLSSPEITKFYDILSQLQESSVTSIAISMSICLLLIILCTRVLKYSTFSTITIFIIVVWTVAILIFLGWKVSVVESTIIIITIGLSFDYTLHYIVSICEHDSDSVEENIRYSHNSAGVACLFGSITLLIAGLPLVFTLTLSFFQIGTMLIILGTISLLGASIILPALLVISSSKRIQITRM